MPLKALALFAWALASSRAYSGAAVDLQYNRYVGSDGVTVDSPYTALDLRVDDRTSAGLGYTLDAVSGASFDYARSKTHRNDPQRQAGSCLACHKGVDAMTGATKNYYERRQEFDFHVSRRMGNTVLKPSYIRSEENDYLSDAYKLELEHSFFKDNSTLTLNLSRLSDLVKPSWNFNGTKTLSTDSFSLGLSQTLSPSTLSKFSADFASADGFQSNPYASIEWGGYGYVPLAERHPLEKRRLDLSGNLKQALPWDASAELGYRYYADSWEVNAHTLDLSLAKRAGPLVIEPSWRGYTQNAAYFFKNFYEQPQTYMSRDLKLAAYSTQTYSLSVRGEMGRGWSGELRYSKLQRQDNLDYRLYFADGPLNADMVMLTMKYQ